MRFVYEICKLQREWKREWNRLTELLLALNWSSLPQWYVLFDSLLVFWLVVGTWHARHLIWHTLFTSRVYSRVVLSLSGLSTDTRMWWLGILDLLASSEISQRSTIGQSVFCIILDGSGLLHLFLVLHALLCLRDATIRPVLKHGPRSSTGLRVVEFSNKLNRRSESNFSLSYDVRLTTLLQYKLIMFEH